MLRLASNSGRLETGGILVGRYSPYGDRVLVTRAVGPPRDSRRFPTAFIRGVIGLRERLHRLWVAGEYYIGEWHFHPYGSPKPSETDRRQIAEFAADHALMCPHPVMIVVGGDPVADWRLATVALVDGAIVELAEDAASRSPVTTARS